MASPSVPVLLFLFKMHAYTKAVKNLYNALMHAIKGVVDTLVGVISRRRNCSEMSSSLRQAAAPGMGRGYMW